MLNSQAQTQIDAKLWQSILGLKSQKTTKAVEKKLVTHTTTYDYDGTNEEYLYDSYFTYNTTGTVATEIQKANGTPTQKTSYTYDPEATALLTKTTVQGYSADSQTWSNEVEIQRCDVTRNSAGQVTKIVEYDLGDDNTLEESMSFTIAYATDGTANEIGIVMGNDLMGEIEMSLTDIKWIENNGQELAELGSVFSLIGNGKHISSATMSYTIMGLPLSGPLTVTYADNGDIEASVSLGFYGTTYMSMDIQQIITDENGSYQLNMISDAMGDAEYDRTAVTLDKNGNTTLIETFEGTTANDLEQSEGEKTEYTYSDGVNIAVAIHSTWNESDDAYTPEKKVVYDENTTGINSLENTISSPAERIYTIDGKILNENIETLPSGLYIVRQAGETHKVMKR